MVECNIGLGKRQVLARLRSQDRAPHGQDGSGHDAAEYGRAAGNPEAAGCKRAAAEPREGRIGRRDPAERGDRGTRGCGSEQGGAAVARDAHEGSAGHRDGSPADRFGHPLGHGLHVREPRLHSAAKLVHPRSALQGDVAQLLEEAHEAAELPVPDFELQLSQGFQIVRTACPRVLQEFLVSPENVAAFLVQALGLPVVGVGIVALLHAERPDEGGSSDQQQRQGHLGVLRVPESGSLFDQRDLANDPVLHPDEFVAGKAERTRDLGHRFDFGDVILAVHVANAHQLEQREHLGPPGLECRGQLFERALQGRLPDRTRERGEDLGLSLGQHPIGVDDFVRESEEGAFFASLQVF